MSIEPLRVTDPEAVQRWWMIVVAVTLTIAQFAMSMTARAQAPDAGRYLRELEASPALPQPTEKRGIQAIHTELTNEAEAATPAGDASLLVERFSISGNAVFPDHLLQALLHDMLGTQQNLDGLRNATDRISRYYRKAGYLLARAYLPAQEITNGCVEIRVLEGTYGHIDIANNSRLRDRALRAPLHRLQAGDAIRRQPLESTLTILNTLPGVSVTARLHPGAEPGTSDLLVEARPSARLSGSMEVDNFGGELTGQHRLGGSMQIANPFGLADLLQLRVLGSDKQQRYYRGLYQRVVGPRSTRLQLEQARMRYALGGAFSALQANGQATITGATLQQPLLVGNHFTMYASLGHERKRLRDDLDLFDLSTRKRTTLWKAGLHLEVEDGLAGGGRTTAYLVQERGVLHLLDPDSRDNDRNINRAAGRFARTSVSVIRLQSLGKRSLLTARGSAQWASRNLDGSEKFSIGGPYGVRAYPLDITSGDEGWQAALEWRTRPLLGWQAGVFVEKGHLRINRRPWNTEQNRLSLAAGGMTLSHAGRRHQLHLTGAWPIDSDAPFIDAPSSPRLWLQASRFF